MQGESNDSAETAAAVVADEYNDVDDDDTTAASAAAADDDDDDESTNETAGALCRWLITFSWRWVEAVDRVDEDTVTPCTMAGITNEVPNNDVVSSSCEKLRYDAVPIMEEEAGWKSSFGTEPDVFHTIT